MEFSQFLSQAWNDHATNADEVAKRLPDAIAFITKPEQIASLSGLATHLFGEHLGEWQNGINFLEKLKSLPTDTTSLASIERSIAALKLPSGDESGLKGLVLSDQIQVLSVASAALNGQKRTSDAVRYYKRALALADAGLSKTDNANRSLAVTSNNLACELEERKDRTQADTDLMLLAAKTARKYWEIAGTWQHVATAEYRLAMSTLKAAKPQEALVHAEACADMCRANSAGALDLFFGFEALARCGFAMSNTKEAQNAVAQAEQCFLEVPDQEKKWCEASLHLLRELSKAELKNR